jgi:hypothetical protein
MLVELGLVLGALIFIFGAVLSLGRFLNQLAWLSQTNYNVVLEGGSNSGSSVQEDMRNRAAQLWGATQRMVRLSAGMAFERDISHLGAGAVDRTINFELHGVLSSIFGQPLPVPVRMRLQGPVLTGSLAGAGNLNNFAPSNLFYDCSGTPCDPGAGACPTAPCAVCTWTGTSFSCPCTTAAGDKRVW